MAANLVQRNQVNLWRRHESIPESVDEMMKDTHKFFNTFCNKVYKLSSNNYSITCIITDELNFKVVFDMIMTTDVNVNCFTIDLLLKKVTIIKILKGSQNRKFKRKLKQKY